MDSFPRPAGNSPTFDATQGPPRRFGWARARTAAQGFWLGFVARIKRAAPWSVLLLLPFAMFHWMFPFLGAKSIGNDYVIFPISAQLDLMWSIHKGTFPVYMPGFAEGHSTASMTLGQLYHPITWLSSFMPGYWKGHALEWNTTFRLLMLGLAHVLAFRVCRRLSLGRFASFAATFPLIYNLRMLDSLRYGASFEAYTGMILLGASAGLVYLNPNSKRHIALLGFFCYTLIVSGHPQWAYLGMLAATMFAALFPWIARALSPRLAAHSIRSLWVYAKNITVGLGTGALLGMIYVLPFYFEYFKTNRTRAENAYKWTLLYSDSLTGELANFFIPMHSDVHGAFGGSALFIIAALFPLALFTNTRKPTILWISWGLAAIAFAFAAGSHFWGGAVHKFMVTYLPAFTAFRAPGRLVIWIPIFLWPVWAWLFRDDNRRALVLTCIGGFLVLVSKWFWRGTGLPKTEYTTPHKIYLAWMPSYIDVLLISIAAATLIAFAVAAHYKRLFAVVGFFAMGLVVVSSWYCLRYGTWTQFKQPTWTMAKISKDRRASQDSHSDPGEGMELRSVTEYRKQKIGIDRPFGSIAHMAEKMPYGPELLARLKRIGDKAPLYFESEPRARSPERVADASAVRLTYNTSNRFVFEATAAKDGYFVLGQPWLSGFEAKVDGQPASIEIANGIFPTVFLPRGAHVIEFRFVSKPFYAGALIAYLTTCAWIVAFLRHRWSTRRAKWIAAGTFAIVSAGLVVLLQLTLYRGPSFRTQFRWQEAVSDAGH